MLLAGERRDTRPLLSLYNFVRHSHHISGTATACNMLRAIKYSVLCKLYTARFFLSAISQVLRDIRVVFFHGAHEAGQSLYAHPCWRYPPTCDNECLDLFFRDLCFSPNTPSVLPNVVASNFLSRTRSWYSFTKYFVSVFFCRFSATLISPCPRTCSTQGSNDKALYCPTLKIFFYLGLPGHDDLRRVRIMPPSRRTLSKESVSIVWNLA